jgi:hypothetical protein
MLKVLLADARRNAALGVFVPLLACACALVSILPALPRGLVLPVVFYWPAPLVWITALSSTIGFSWGKLLFSLPVSRRALGRAAWLSAVVVPVVLVAAGKLMAWTIVETFDEGRVGVGWMAVSTLFDLACAGSTVFLLSASRTVRSRSNWVIAGRTLLVGIGFLAVPMLATLEAPPSTTQVSAFGLVCLFAGLTMTALGFRRSDRLALVGGVKMLGVTAARHSGSRPPEARVTLPPISRSRLVPITRYLWWHFAGAGLFVLGPMALIGLVGFVAGGSDMRSLSSLADDARDLLTEPLQGGSARFYFSMVLLPSALPAVWPLSKPRWLRVLPLAGWEVSALILARGLSSCAALLGIVGVLGFVTDVHPVWLDPGPVILLAGLACMVSVATFGPKTTNPWKPAIFPAIWGLTFASPVLLRYLPSDGRSAEIAMLSIGAVGLITAIVWVHLRVTRSPTIYRPVVTAFELVK